MMTTTYRVVSLAKSDNGLVKVVAYHDGTPGVFPQQIEWRDNRHDAPLIGALYTLTLQQSAP